MVIPDRDEWVEWLKAKAWLLFILGLLAFFGGRAWLARPLDPPAGVLVAEDPIQGPASGSGPWTYRNHQLTPLATFDLRARVLARERYRFDRAAELSPLDLALGWGRMSDSAVLEDISFRQSGRWYYWFTPSFPIPAEEIISHSANMHMVPSTSAVKERLCALRVGQVIRLRGHLIQADGRDQWTWRSSLTRTDSGEGACEIIWVETVETP